MAKIDLKLYETSQSGDSITTTISYINPEASDTTSLQFAQKLANLTSNVYKSTDKVKTINLDTESEAGKTTPTLSLSTSSISKTTISTAQPYINITVTYNGDGVLSTHSTKGNWIGANVDTSTNKLNIYRHPDFVPTYMTEDVTVTLYAAETDNYKAASTTLTITAE